MYTTLEAKMLHALLSVKRIIDREGIGSNNDESSIAVAVLESAIQAAEDRLPSEVTYG